MEIGYVGQNKKLSLTTGHTTRVKDFSYERWINSVNKNFNDLFDILEYNINNNIQCFRISSGFIPLVTHPILEGINWKELTRDDFIIIGDIAREYNLRLSFHPDHFVVINSTREDVVKSSINELQYHADMIDAMNLPNSKMQIHVGGVYGDKSKSIRRFIDVYSKLSDSIKKYLVIENDDVSYSVSDCLEIHNATGIPILFDNLHHECLNKGESMLDAANKCFQTWGNIKPLVDYSSQEAGSRKGRHANTLDSEHFIKYLKILRDHKLDIILEIKDKDSSALKAKQLLTGNSI